MNLIITNFINISNENFIINNVYVFFNIIVRTLKYGAFYLKVDVKTRRDSDM